MNPFPRFLRTRRSAGLLACRPLGSRRPSHMLRLVLLGGLAAGACGDDPAAPPSVEPPPGGQPPDTAPTPPPRVTGMSLDQPAPLVRTLSVELSRADGVEVIYGRQGGDTLRVAATDASTSHALHLVRLEPDASYRVQVRPLTAAADSAPAVDSFSTAPLPDDLARLDFVAEGRPTHPLTVYEITRNASGYEGVVIVDDDGDVVWYRRGSVGGGTLRENGNFVFKQGGDEVIEVAPTGKVVHRLSELPGAPDPHHDVITTPWNTLYVLAHDEREVGDTAVVGEAIWEWAPEAGTLEKRWSAFDHLSWEEDRADASRPGDWLHANSLAIGPQGNVLISFNFLSQVLSLTPDFAEVEWRLGGVNATIPTEGDEVFHHQHTASELSVDGERRVLLFDNGLHARGYSRALELRIDPEAATAEKVWEFVPPNGNHSFIVSLARRLENGNTFVHFGAGPGVILSRGPVETYEVRPDGEVQWHLEVRGEDVGDQFVLYRAWPLDSLVGEERVAPAAGGLR